MCYMLAPTYIGNDGMVYCYTDFDYKHSGNTIYPGPYDMDRYYIDAYLYYNNYNNIYDSSIDIYFHNVTTTTPAPLYPIYITAEGDTFDLYTIFESGSGLDTNIYEGVTYIDTFINRTYADNSYLAFPHMYSKEFLYYNINNDTYNYDYYPPDYDESKLLLIREIKQYLYTDRTTYINMIGQR